MNHVWGTSLPSSSASTRRKAQSRVVARENILEFRIKWLRRSSQMTINFGEDEEIDTLSSGLQIAETSTSHEESPRVTDNDTWSDGEIAPYVVILLLRQALALSIAEQTSHSQTCKLTLRRHVAASLLSMPPTTFNLSWSPLLHKRSTSIIICLQF